MFVLTEIRVETFQAEHYEGKMFFAPGNITDEIILINIDLMFKQENWLYYFDSAADWEWAST